MSSCSGYSRYKGGNICWAAARTALPLLLTLMFWVALSAGAWAHTHAGVEPHSHPFAHIHTSPEHQLAPSDFDNAPPDLVLWGELAKASVTRKGGQYHVTFLPSVLELDGKTISLIGFMAPVHPGTREKQFLLSDIRFLCGTCQAAPPPEAIVEVNAQQAQPLSERPITVRGKLELVRDSRYGLIYRLHNAQVMQP